VVIFSGVSAAMSVDPKLLQRDARGLLRTRRRKGRGTTEAIRALLPTIYRLRSEGVLWREIAEALGKQGIVQGQGKKRKPITTTRLTALVRQIEARTQNEPKPPSIKKAQGEKARATKMRPLSLAIELGQEIGTSNRRSEPSEEVLRRAALDRIQDVLKKD
jgi:hypothetical protein